MEVHLRYSASFSTFSLFYGPNLSSLFKSKKKIPKRITWKTIKSEMTNEFYKYCIRTYSGGPLTVTVISH